MADKDLTNAEQGSTIGRLVSKLGLALSRTKDALLKDLLGDIPNYLPEATVEEMTVQEFVDWCRADGNDPVTRFLGCVFSHLGYDITHFEKSQELMDLVRSVVCAIDSVSTLVQELGDEGAAWVADFDRFVREGGTDESEAQRLRQFWGDPDTEPAATWSITTKHSKTDISFGDFGDGKLSKLIDLVQELMRLMKRFYDFEWDKLADEGGDFLEWMKETYFTLDFAKCLFDHVMVVMLKNVREVFADDIDEVVNRLKSVEQQVRKGAEELMKEAKERVGEAYDELKAQLDEAVRQMQEIEAEMKKGVREMERALESELRVARQRVESLNKQIFGDYNKVGRVMNQIYTVLDFMNVIDRETIPLKQYVQGGLQAAEAEAQKKVDEVEKALAVVTDRVNFSTESLSAEAKEKVSEAVNALTSYVPDTVDIYVIRWNRFGAMMTNPLDYFRQLYPMRGYSDAEKLLGKVMDVVCAFTDKVPHYGSISEVLLDLLARLRQHIDLQVNLEGAQSEMVRKLTQMKDFIYDLLKVLESYAISIKQELTNAFHDLEHKVDEATRAVRTAWNDTTKELNQAVNDAKRLKNTFEKQLNAQIEQTKKEIEKVSNDLPDVSELQQKGVTLVVDLVKEVSLSLQTTVGQYSFKVPESNIKFKSFSSTAKVSGKEVERFFEQQFLQPFIAVVKEKAKGYDLLSGIDAEQWEQLLTEAADSGKSLYTEYQSILADAEAYVTNMLSIDYWTGQVKQVLEQLKAEFEKQTAAVPTSMDQLKKFGQEQAQNLIAGKSLSNPFSGFDFNQYVTIVSQGLKGMVPDSPEVFYSRFKEATDKYLTTLLTQSQSADEALRATLEGLKKEAEKLKPFVKEVFNGYWKELKESLRRTLVEPFKAQIEAAVKCWLTQSLLPNVVDYVVKSIESHVDINRYINLFVEEAEEMVDTVESALNDLPGQLPDVELPKLPANAAEKAERVREMVNDIVGLANDARSISTWSDGLQFALKLYKLIPPSVKEYVSELVNLPRFDMSQVHLPAYKLDAEKKFLAVTLYQYPEKKDKDDNKGKKTDKPDEGKGEKKNYALDGSVSIQLVAFVGDRYVLDEEGKIKTEKDEESGEEEKVVTSGLYLLPVIKGNFDVAFNIGKSHMIQINTSASLNDKSTQGYLQEKKEEKKKEEDDKGKVLASETGEDGTAKLYGEEDSLKLEFNDKEEKKEKEQTPEEKEKKEKEKALQTLQDGTLGFFFTTDEENDMSVEMLAGKYSAEAKLEVVFQRGQAGQKKAEPLQILDSKVCKITMADYPQRAYVLWDSKGFDTGYKGEVKELKLVLSLKELNGFFEAVLKNDIEIDLEKLMLGYTYRDGFTFDGALSLKLPINKEINLKAVKFNNLEIELGTFNQFRSIKAGVNTSFVADFHGIKFALSDMGMGLSTELFTEDWKLADFNLKPSFKFPDGIGVTVDLEAVKGTGLVRWNTEKGEFVGALELSVMSLFSCGALVMFNTKNPDGSKGFSFMGALTVYFTPAIQLGFGFGLSGVGGALGVNRYIKQDKLIASVHEGTLNSLVFVKDIEKNLDTMLNNLGDYYPVKQGSLFFGLMGQISWAEIVKVDMGLFIQAPDPVLVILIGGLHIKVSDSAEKLLSINVNMMGMFDSSRGISFDAELVDSYLVGIDLYGSMALRIFWAGPTKGFLFSAGGFHPEYTPPKGMLVDNMKRLGLKLDYSPLKISMESYFAVTSNTVQFGAAASLLVGWKQFGLSGEFYFNALFQFKPFHFLFDAGLAVGVKCGSWTLLSVSLQLAVSGPAKWHVKGKASFWFLFVKIGCSFAFSWGKSQDTESRQYIDLLPLFTDAYNDNGNWAIQSDDIVEGLVSISKSDEEGLIINSSDRLLFNQNAVPLDRDIQRVGEALPGDVKQISIVEIKVGSHSFTDMETLTTLFAPAQYTDMTDQEKLKAENFEQMHSGFSLATLFDDQQGSTSPLTVQTEYQHESVDMTAWQNYASQQKKAVATAAKQETTPDTAQQTPAGWAATASRKVTHRRSEMGFQRYIKQLDQSMGSRMQHRLDTAKENATK